MKLKVYLKEHNYTQMSFIKAIEEEMGIRIPQGTLAKWILETRIPRKSEMVHLYKFTKGKVMPNDFYLE